MPRHILVLIIPIFAFLLIAIFAPNVLLTVFAGVLVGVFLRLGGNAIAKWTGLGKGWSLASFCIIIALLVVAFFSVAAAGLANQFSQLIEQLPQVRDQVRDMASEHDWIVSRLENVDFAGMAPSGSSAATGVMATFGALGNAVLILFIGIYTAVSPSEYRDGAAALFRPSQKDRYYAMLKSSWDALSGWLFAQLVSMTVIGVLTWIGLWALGVPLAPILGVLAGLLAFIPNIGPVLAALPAMAMGLSEGGTTVLWIAGLYTAVQALESYLITPQLQQKAVSLPPALTIAFQLLMGYLFGLMGLALATPILAMILALIREHYVPDVVQTNERRSTVV